MDSENLSSLIRLSVSDGQKTDSSKVVSVTGTFVYNKDQLSLNIGQKYCRMLQGDHSAILLTFIRLPVVIKIFVLSIFEWPFYTGFTV